MKRGKRTRFRLLAVGVVFALGVGFIVAGRGAADLRTGARMMAQWDDRKATLRMPTPQEIAALPGEARELHLSNLNKEGGDTMNLINDYASESEWFYSLADERAARRDTGWALVGLSALGLGIALWVGRLERRAAVVE